MGGLSTCRPAEERQQCSHHNDEVRPQPQFHHGARASCRRNLSARASSAFAVGHVSGSHCVSRMSRISSATRGQGSRKGSTGG